MRVLVLANNAVGLYNFRKELFERMIALKYEIYISLPYENTVDMLINKGGTFIDTQIDRRGINPITDLKLMCKYLKIIKQIKPDVVLTYTIKPNIYGGMACASLNIPYIANITGLGTAVENKGILQILTKNMYRFALRKAKCVFFQNSRNRDFFVNNKMIKTKYRLIPGSGVNLTGNQALDYPEKDTVDFFFIGRVMKEKGIDEYLQAAHHIGYKYDNTVFHICGFCEKEYKNKLQYLEKEKHVIYHGMCDNMTQMQKINSCTVHPSYHEGMSNVLLETCACARPALCSDIPGCHEIIENGYNGFLFKPGDTESLIGAIEGFLNLSYAQRRQMGINARKKVEKEFDRNIVINAYMEEINKIAGENNG